MNAFPLLEHYPLGLIERAGMLAYPLWLKLHEDDPGSRFGRAIVDGAGIHPRSVKHASQTYEDLNLVKLHRPTEGRGARTEHTLTARGNKFATTILQLDNALQAELGIRKPKSSDEPLRPNEHPLLELEAASSWRFLHHIEKHSGDAEECFVRMIQHRLKLPPNQVLGLRDRMHAIGLLTLEGVAKGGRGARIILHLTPLGLHVAEQGHKLAPYLRL